VSHAEHHNVLYPLQHGFRPGRSCETQFLEMVHDVVNSMQRGLQINICVLDFSEVFNKVGHKHLVEKLRMYGVDGESNIWKRNFLRDRSWSVLVERLFWLCPSYLRHTSRICTGPCYTAC